MGQLIFRIMPLVLLCTSCLGQKSISNNINDLNINFQIKNDLLKENVLSYINDIKKNEGLNRELIFKITLNSLSGNDNYQSYLIQGCYDVYCIYDDPIHSYFKLGGELVFFSIENLETFTLDKDSIWEVFQKRFNSMIDYYNEVNDYPPPITGSPKSLKLVFKNDNLIKKEIINYSNTD